MFFTNLFTALALMFTPAPAEDGKYSAENRIDVLEQSEQITLNMVDPIDFEEFNKLIQEENARIQRVMQARLEEDKKQITCMADAVYYEARGEPYRGKLGVLHVIQNRVDDARWPDNHCDVVYQRTPRRGGGGTICQFSWACMGLREPRPALYEEQYQLASDFYYNPEEFEDVTNGSNFFHANYVNPRWRYQRRVQLGAHIFYEG